MWRIIGRNFLGVIRRFKMAALLNILGLSVAFATCILIAMQLDYDLNYGKCHKDADSIFRLERNYNGMVAPIFPTPFLDVFVQSSPHIVAGALALNIPWEKELPFSLQADYTGKQNFVEPVLKVTPDFTKVYQFSMSEGSAEALHEPDKVLLPTRMAQKLFGQTSALGKALITQEGTYTVGGVYEEFPKNALIDNCIYLPLSKEVLAGSNWINSMYELTVRLDSPENSAWVIDNFLATMGEPVKQFLENNPPGELSFTNITDLHFATHTVFDNVPKVSQTTLWVLLAIAVVIIIIACINFTNFSIALTPMRIANINTQKVLGAEPWKLRLSMVMEAVIMCSVSYGLAICLVYLSNYTPISRLLDADIILPLHTGLLIITGLIALGIGLVSGIYPAFYSTSFSPALVLKGSFGLSPKGRNFRNALISIQYIASFILIIGSICMYIQNRFMQESSLGYQKDGLLVTEMTHTLKENQEALSNELSKNPAIEGITFSDLLIGSSDQYYSFGIGALGERIDFQVLPVHYNFPELLEIEVTDGRTFQKEDERKQQWSLIFNETARKRYQLETGALNEQMAIIGFMPDIKFASFRAEVEPMAFCVWPENRMGESQKYGYVKVKAGANLYEAREHVVQSLMAIDPNYGYEPRFFDTVLQQLYEKEESLSSLITLFGLAAIFISIVGVFGLVVFESEYRRKEIGVRKVFGSTTEQIIYMFNKIYLRIVIVCFVIAAPVAYYIIMRWLENFAYKTPISWWVFLFSLVAVSVITSLTVSFQNWQAANENPANSLKAQ